MQLSDFFTPSEHVVQHGSKAIPREKFRDNIVKQRQILDGEKPLSSTGKVVAPTITKQPDDSYLFAIKYGGFFVKLDGQHTHFKVPADKVRPALDFLIEASLRGDFDEQLEAISAKFRSRLKSKKVKATPQAGSSV